MFSSYNPPIISSIYLQNLEISATEAEAAAKQAQTGAEAARDLALQYKNEAETYYTQVQQIQTGDYVTSQSLADTLANFGFADLASVPSVYAPSAHGHDWNEITRKPATFAPAPHTHLWEQITGKPSEFEPAEHAHSWLQIEGKPATFPPEMHYHDWSSIQNKPNVFNPAAHTHSWGDISGKPAVFTPAAHTHDWEGIQNKPLEFEPSSHSHHWDTVTHKPEQATRWPSVSEVENLPGISVAASSNSLVKRDTGGRIKTAAPDDSDDAVNKGFLKQAATRDVASQGDTDVSKLMPVGFAGIGYITTTPEIDLNTGVYVETGATIISSPVGQIINGPDDPVTSSRYIVTFDGALDNGVQKVTNRVSGITWQRSFYTGDNIGDWVEIYTSGNINFDEFEVKNGDYLGVNGIPITNTVVRFEKSLNSYTQPAGIDVQLGSSFDIVENDTGTTVASGVVPVLGSTSTSRDGHLNFTIPSTTTGKTYRAIAVADSKITFNF